MNRPIRYSFMAGCAFVLAVRMLCEWIFKGWWLEGILSILNFASTGYLLWLAKHAKRDFEEECQQERSKS